MGFQACVSSFFILVSFPFSFFYLTLRSTELNLFIIFISFLYIYFLIYLIYHAVLSKIFQQLQRQGMEYGAASK